MEEGMRKTEEEIRAKRERRDVTLLVTGATGFLGSHLAVELLRRGYRVVLLCRPTAEFTTQQRIGRLLNWFGVDDGLESRLGIVEGFIDQPMLGMDREQYIDLGNRIDEIFHCAANTSFAERKRPQIELANVSNLKNVLDLAAAGSCYFFHQFSTAYVAGKRTGHCPETFVETEQFTNVYEETKHKGEQAALEVCSRAGLRLNIYRPSIVYGDSASGRTLRFSAVYYPVKTALYFKKIFLRDIMENGGTQAKEMGVHMDGNGTMHLPIRIEKKDEGGVNVVPVDYFVEASMAIMEESLDGGIFHIVNDRLTKLDDLVDYTQRHFNIEGIRTVEKEELDATPRNALEALVRTYIEIYEPYMRDTRVFGIERSGPILKKRKILCPDFDYEMFKRCMSYAVEVDWGNGLYEPRTPASQTQGR